MRPIFMLIVCLLLGPLSTQAQNGYTLVGSAYLGASADCIKITSSGTGLTGAVWLTKRLNIKESFELSVTINLGSNPAGADGMAIVFQTQSNKALGGQVGNMGYQGIQPSLSIEFDTYQNPGADDPPYDHIALVRNGVSDHRLNTSFAAPVPISPTQNNVKDGRDRYVSVRWDVKTRTLRVEVDCITRINQTLDLVNTIFSGTSEVIWGLTAATGTQANEHTVCFPKAEIIPDTVQACRGDQITLMSPLSSTGQYGWSPATGLDNPKARSPRLRAGNSQLYRVQYFDQCGQPKLDSVFVNAKGTAFTLGEDRQVCGNETVTLKPTFMSASTPVTYRWSTGDVSLQLNPVTSGVYALTVTGNGCSVSDSVRVTFNPLPTVNLTADPSYDCLGGQPIQLDPGATGPGLRYLWTPGKSSAATLLADIPGHYTVIVTTAANCSATQGFTILNNCPSTLLFMPDAFTPNGDGVNDVLVWKGRADVEVQMNVFNRWGELIFSSNNSTLYWDGTYQGNACPSGIYAWNLRYRSRLSIDSQWFNTEGRVMLVK